jgi:hypothetical protein
MFLLSTLAFSLGLMYGPDAEARIHTVQKQLQQADCRDKKPSASSAENDHAGTSASGTAQTLLQRVAGRLD